MRYAISACLMGENCKYNGGNNFHQNLYDYMQGNDYLCICPEMLGGLPSPRVSCEILNGCVKGEDGQDYTKAFHLGAMHALNLIQAYEVDLVITQSRSPSCGKGKIYDGTFTKKLQNGDGIFVNLMKNEKITVKSYEEFLTDLGK